MNIIKYAKLYLLFIKFRLMRDMTYRVDFALWALVNTGWFTFNIMFWNLLFGQVNSIAGWSKGEVFILQGFFFLIEFVIWGLIYSNLYALPRDINKGNLDFLLTKPVNTQFIISFRNISFDNLPSFLLGIATIIYGLKLVEITPTISQFVTSVTIFVIGAIYLYAGYFISVCSAFWFGRLHDIVYLFPSIRHFTKIPLPAYKGISLIIFTYVFPATLIASFPSQSLFGQISLIPVIYLIALTATTLFLSSKVLSLGLRQYSSAN